jgi:PEP-CTERM motif
MLKRTAVATVLALSALGASAAVTVDVGDVATPGNFEFASLVSGTFDLGTLTADGASKVTYSFIGKEAGFTNEFRGAGAGLIDSTGGADIVDLVGPGALSFSFGTVGEAGSASNGMVFSLVSNPSFAIFKGASGSGYQYVLGFNDIGAGNDSDFDDLVIGVNFTPVPEPGTYALILAGLAAVGFVARRRRS